jgi:dienelactone hydrolase
VLRPFCHALDWLAIQLACRSPQRGVNLPEPKERLTSLLAHADFYSNTIAPLNGVDFSGEHHFSFASPLPCPWDRNNTVHGRIYRADQDWTKRPAVILLHGWNGELNYELLFPWMGRRLAREGVTALSVLLPYHGRRKPREAGAIRNFICDDIGSVLAATRQSLADCRALVRWLHRQGCPRIGLFGLSFGGWLTGLLACHEPLISSAALGTPISRMDRALRELAFCRPLKEQLEHYHLAVEQFDLVNQKPLVKTERLLLLESEHDLFAPAGSVEELWEAWQKPEIWRVPHGHISVLCSGPVMKRTADWLIRQSSGIRPV